MQTTLDRLIQAGRWVVPVVCMVLLIAGIRQYRGLPPVPAEPKEDELGVVSWPEVRAFSDEDWSVFELRAGGAPGRMGPLAERYRLAGTFFAYPHEATPDSRSTRQAILDDVRERKQHLVQEGDAVGEAHVISIFRDRIILRAPAGQEELWLSFMGVAEEPAVDDVAEADTPPLRFEDMEALETSRFGKRIAENRWVMQRDALLAYADEVQEDAERLAALFLAMQPDIQDGEIAGYQLHKQGEDILYEAAGMKEGDIVRMVNSMPMTSPARAQYFFNEFFSERVSAIVFDIERDGEEEKLIYLIR